MVMRRQWDEAVRLDLNKPKGLDDVLSLLKSNPSDDERDSFVDYERDQDWEQQ